MFALLLAMPWPWLLDSLMSDGQDLRSILVLVLAMAVNVAVLLTLCRLLGRRHTA